MSNGWEKVHIQTRLLSVIICPYNIAFNCSLQYLFDFNNFPHRNSCYASLRNSLKTMDGWCGDVRISQNNSIIIWPSSVLMLYELITCSSYCITYHCCADSNLALTLSMSIPHHQQQQKKVKNSLRYAPCADNIKHKEILMKTLAAVCVGLYVIAQHARSFSAFFSVAQLRFLASSSLINIFFMIIIAKILQTSSDVVIKCANAFIYLFFKTLLYSLAEFSNKISLLIKGKTTTNEWGDIAENIFNKKLWLLTLFITNAIVSCFSWLFSFFLALQFAFCHVPSFIYFLRVINDSLKM